MMKSIQLCVVGFALVLSPLTSLGSTYLGDFCWVAENTDGTLRYFKLGISEVGGGHFSVHGLWMNEDASAKSPVSGSAELIDGEWELSVLRADSSPDFTAFRSFHFDLGPGANGIARVIGLNTGDRTVRQGELPLTFTNCANLPN